MLLAEADISEAGPLLARRIRRFRGSGTSPAGRGPLRRVRGRCEQERLLSMLTAFLGARSVRELRLPLRPPWAFGYLLPLDALRYHVIGRTGRGRQLLGARGLRTSRRILDGYFGDEAEHVGAPTVSDDG